MKKLMYFLNGRKSVAAIKCVLLFEFFFLTNSGHGGSLLGDGVFPPVMPNSIFEPVVRSMPAGAGVDGAALPGKLVSMDREVLLNGAWKYCPDPERRGKGEAPAWFSVNYDDSGWEEMIVPSNYGREDAGLEDFFEPVWFRLHFNVSEKRVNDRITLRFMGVDYFAEVWLNGIALQNGGAHEGYFNPFQFDVTGKLKPGENLLTVMVTCPYDIGMLQLLGKITPAITEKVWVKGVLAFHDTRPGATLSADESQSQVTGGIYGDVILRFTGDVTLDWTFITPVISASDAGRAADVRMLQILTNHGKTAKDIIISTIVDGGTFSMDEPCTLNTRVTLSPGSFNVEQVVRIREPRLWWVWDHPELGEPALYKTCSRVIEGNIILDSRDDTFGIRNVAMKENGQEPFIWYLNGSRIFVRGTNLISTQWMAEADEELYQKDVAMMKDVNMNMARIHCHTAPEKFYDIADREGMLLYQDFSSIWEYSVCKFKRNNGDPALLSNSEVMERMVAELIYLLYNHPSIVLWNLQNEPYHFMFKSSPHAPDLCMNRLFNENRYPLVPLDLSFNLELAVNHLVPVAESLDPTRPIHMASGKGDSHEYFGWYKGVFMDAATWEAPFPTEFGAESVPFSAEAFMKYLGDGWFPPVKPHIQHMWHYHDAQLPNLGYYTGRASTEYDIFNDWAYATQLYQAGLLKFIAEHFRIRKYNPTGGMLMFDFTSWWESTTWGLLDHKRTPKLAYFWYKNIQNPVFVTTEADKNLYGRGEKISFPLYVINDLYKKYSGAVLRWRITKDKDSFILRGDPASFLDRGYPDDPPTFLGVPPACAVTILRGPGGEINTVDSGEFTFDIPEDSVVKQGTVVFKTPFIVPEPQHYTLHMDLVDSSGKLLSGNWHHFMVVSSPSLFPTTLPKGLSPLPRFNLKVATVNREGVPEPDVYVEVRGKYSNEILGKGYTDSLGILTFGKMIPGEMIVTGEKGGKISSMETQLLWHDSVKLEL